MEKINIDKLNELEKSGLVDSVAASDLRNLDKQGITVKWNTDGNQYEYITKDGYTYSGKTGKGTRKGLFRGANKAHKNISDAMYQLRGMGGFDKIETPVKEEELVKKPETSTDTTTIDKPEKGTTAERDAITPLLNGLDIPTELGPVGPIKLVPRPREGVDLDFQESILERKPAKGYGFWDKGLFENLLQGANFGDPSGALPSIGRQADDVTSYIGGTIQDIFTPFGKTDYSDEAVKDFRSRQSIATARLFGNEYDEWAPTIDRREFEDAVSAGWIDENGKPLFEFRDDSLVNLKTGEIKTIGGDPFSQLGLLAPNVSGASGQSYSLGKNSKALAKLQNFYNRLGKTKVGGWLQKVGLKFGDDAAAKVAPEAQTLIEGTRPVLQQLPEASRYTKGLTKAYNAATGTKGSKIIYSNQKGGKLVRKYNGGGKGLLKYKVDPTERLGMSSPVSAMSIVRPTGPKILAPKPRQYTEKEMGLLIEEANERVNQLRGSGKVDQNRGATYDYIKTPVGDFGYGDIADLGVKLATSRRPDFKGTVLQPHQTQPELVGTVEHGLTAGAQADIAKQAADIQAEGDATSDALVNKQDDLARAIAGRDIATKGVLANEAELARQEEINRDIENKNLIAKGQTQLANENMINQQRAMDAALANQQQGANNKFLASVGDAFISTRQRAGYNKDVSTYNNRIEADREYQRELNLLYTSNLAPDSVEFQSQLADIENRYKLARQRYTTPEGVEIYNN
jgi:hypothetical protein